MARLAAGVLLLCIGLVQPALAAGDWPALIGAEEMKARLATPRLRIVDLREAPVYAGGHADGAVSMPVAHWKAAAEEDRLPEVIGEAGIHPERPLLLVHADTEPGNFTDTAWIAWELRSRGIASVAVLAGGMAAWRDAGIRVTERVHAHRTYRDDYARTGETLSAEDELEEIRLGLVRGGLVEARSVGRASVPRVKGAEAISLAELIGPDGLDDLPALLERVKAAPLPWEAGRVVVLAESPEPAGALWFLVSEVLGIRGVSVTPESPEDLGIAHLLD